MTLYYDQFDSPIGPLTIAGNQLGLAHILFASNKHEPRDQAHWRHNPEVVAGARSQLLEYLSGARRHFDLQLAPIGTPFQLRVWNALAEIPYGHTWSYAQLAAHIGHPAAMRAVGGANGRNPLPIVLPCHRVIGRDGRLTGFGGGLPTKQALLSLEGAWPSALEPPSLF